MIIPIKCVTCNKTLADKWKYYSEKVAEFEEEIEKNGVNSGENSIKEPKFQNFEPGFRKKILDDLGLFKMCCRRHMLCHIDLIDII